MTKVSKMSTYRSFNHQNLIVYRYSTDSIFLLASHHRMIMCHVHRKKLATTSTRVLHLYLPVERYRIDKKSLPFAISIFFHPNRAKNMSFIHSIWKRRDFSYVFIVEIKDKLSLNLHFSLFRLIILTTKHILLIHTEHVLLLFSLANVCLDTVLPNVKYRTLCSIEISIYICK